MSPRHLTGFVIALVGAALIAPGADAALKKYRLELVQINESTNVSPNPKVSRFSDFETRLLPWAAPGSRVVIDDSGASPVLKQLLYIRDGTATTVVPALGGFIFTSNNTREGPVGDFTGTGSTETTIAWGLLTGWTNSGTWWCHSAPSFVCPLASRVQDESVDPTLHSALYDLGTWTFHGTGWTGTPFLQQTFDQPIDGNMQYYFWGTRIYDGSVPALPAVGLGVLGGSLVFGGLAALRRRRG